MATSLVSKNHHLLAPSTSAGFLMNNNGFVRS